jgi:hypothetical protein
MGRERQDETGAADRLRFHDFCDFDPAYGPAHPALPHRFHCSGKDAGFPVPVQWII